MPRLVYLDKPKADIVDITDSITGESGSATIAEGYVAKILTSIETLAAMPGPFGRPRTELRDGLRSFPSGSHIVFFRYRGDTIEVVTVLQGSRDFKEYFANDDE